MIQVKPTRRVSFYIHTISDSCMYREVMLLYNACEVLANPKMERDLERLEFDCKK